MGRAQQRSWLLPSRLVVYDVLGLALFSQHLDGYITAVESLLRFQFGNKPAEEGHFSGL